MKLLQFMLRVALAVLTAVNMFKRIRKRKRKMEQNGVRIGRNIEQSDAEDSKELLM